MHPAIVADQVVAAEAAVTAARDTKVLEHLADGPATSARLADELGLDRRLLARLLDALVALGVATVTDDDRYRARPAVLRALEASARYGGLEDALRGRPRHASVHESSSASTFYEDLVGVLGEAFADAAEEVADLLATPGVRVLDVGAGAAPWSLAIVRREPAARAVAVDLPDVAPATRRAAVDAGVADRVDVVEGDLFAGALHDELGGPFDLVLVANVCHLFDREDVVRLLADLAPHLAPGGRLAIVDVLPEQVTTDPRLALYALGLSLRTTTGGLHGRGDYGQWLQAAGLDDVEVHPTSDGIAVVVGRLPARSAPAHPPWPTRRPGPWTAGRGVRRTASSRPR